MPRKPQIGDYIRIKENSVMHCFEKGEIVRIVLLDECGIHGWVKAENDKGIIQILDRSEYVLSSKKGKKNEKN